MKRFSLVVLIWLAAVDVALAAGSSFGRPQRATLAWYWTMDVAIGDVDGDGRKDLVVSARDYPDRDYKVSFFLQGQDGRLASPVDVRLPPSDLIQYKMALADLDDDGRDEAIVGTPDATGIQVLRLEASGSVSSTKYAGPAFSCRSIVAGDADRDGNADVVCHDESITAIAYFGDGRGGFRATRAMQTLAGDSVDGTPHDFKTLQLADVTGDGYPDLLVSAGHSPSFHVLANNRLGGFFPGVAYPHPRSADGYLAPSFAIRAVDMDGDGSNEVLTASPDARPYAALNLYRRGSNGFLSLTERIPVHDFPTAILAGDVGADGGVDVVLAHYTFNSISVLGEDGGGLASQFLYDLPGFGNHVDLADTMKQYAVALGDLDGDGCNDLAAATASGATILYGCEPFSPSLPVSDFDGDGVSDLLWHLDISGQLYFWPWANSRYLAACGWRQDCPGVLGGKMEGQAVGDFDGDGNSDVFWRTPVTGANMLRWGAFYSTPITAVTDPGWRVVAAGDFDGDDRADLLWRHVLRGTNAIWRSANYRMQQPVWSVTDTRWQVVAVGDFDGDRRSDIVWRHAVTGNNAIWRSGNYQTQTAMTAVTNRDWKVRGAGDFNGDGRDDLVWRDLRAGSNVIWLSGDYRTQRALTRVSTTTWDIAAVGDYDGDGISDLFWRNPAMGQNVIWRAGRFDAPQVVEAANAYYTLVR